MIFTNFQKSYVLFLQVGCYQPPYLKKHPRKPLRRNGFRGCKKSLVDDFGGLVAGAQLMSTVFIILDQFAAGSGDEILGSSLVAILQKIYNSISEFSGID